MNGRRKRGTPAGSGSVVEDGVRRDRPQTPEAAAGASALGKFAHIPGTSDDFARRKQEEIDREDANAAESTLTGLTRPGLRPSAPRR